MVRSLSQRIGALLNNDRGAVLIITIFVVALVTILVLEYHYEAAVEIELAENHANDAKAYALAMAGLNLARAVLAKDSNDYDAPDEFWHKLELLGCIPPNEFLTISDKFQASIEALQPGQDPPEELSSPPPPPEVQDCVAIKIVDEDRKLPINLILDDTEIETHWAGITAQLLRALWDGDESSDLPEDAVGAVMDWIDNIAEGSTRGGDVGGEDDYYQTLDPPYKTPGRPIEVPGEIRLIRFFIAEQEPKYERLAKLFEDVESAQIPSVDLGTNLYFSTFSSPDSKVNINTAHPNLLLAMTNNEATCLEQIEEHRNPANDPTQLLVDPITDISSQIPCLTNPVPGLPTIQLRSGDAAPPDYVPADVALSVRSIYFRVESEAKINNESNIKKVVAVFKRPDPGDPPEIVYFKIE